MHIYLYSLNQLVDIFVCICERNICAIGVLKQTVDLECPGYMDPDNQPLRGPGSCRRLIFSVPRVHRKMFFVLLPRPIWTRAYLDPCLIGPGPIWIRPILRLDSGPRIRDSGSRMQRPEFRNLDPGGFRTLNPGSRIMDRGSWIHCPGPRTLDPKFKPLLVFAHLKWWAVGRSVDMLHSAMRNHVTISPRGTQRRGAKEYRFRSWTCGQSEHRSADWGPYQQDGKSAS